MLSHLISTIDIWWTKLDLPSDKVSKFEGYLDEIEIRQINKQKFEWLRNRSIITRGFVKLIISNYLNMDPVGVKFSYNDYGKPFIANDNSKLQFNISHSDEVAVFAFSRYNEIGIDIEKIKDIQDMDGVINICFTDYEKNWYKARRDSNAELFYKVWTAKEAFIKAIGRGFSYNPKNIELTYKSDKQLLISRVISNEFAERNYTIKLIEIQPGYVVSVVYDGEKEIKIYHCDEIP